MEEEEEDDGWKAFEEALERADSLDEFLPAQCRSGEQGAIHTVYNVHGVRKEKGNQEEQEEERHIGVGTSHPRDEALEHEDERWSVFGEGEASPEWSALRALIVARLDPENALYDPQKCTHVDALAHVYGVEKGGGDGVVHMAAAVPPPPLPGPSAMLKALESCTRDEQQDKMHALAVFILVYCLPRWAASHRQVARASLGAAAYSAIRALGLNALDEASFERVVRHIEKRWASDSSIGDHAHDAASLRRELIGAHAASQFPL